MLEILKWNIPRWEMFTGILYFIWNHAVFYVFVFVLYFFILVLVHTRNIQQQFESWFIEHAFKYSKSRANWVVFFSKQTITKLWIATIKKSTTLMCFVNQNAAVKSFHSTFFVCSFSLFKIVHPFFVSFCMYKYMFLKVFSNFLLP